MDTNDPVGVSSTGFLKVGPADSESIDRAKRAALIRKGNELYNQGNLETAKRIFVTVRYSDGLMRLGNYYMDTGAPLEAFRMFWLAGDRRRVEEMTEQMALIVRKWLHEDES
ncbi:MAG: hypothetical protein ACLFR8_05580 [Alkalispirochaeta sp.]